MGGAQTAAGSGDEMERHLRRQICEIGRRMWQRNLVSANDGNVSVRMPDGRVLCTPTGVSKGFMTEVSLPMVTLDGELVETPGALPPSSEIKMHLRAYGESDEVGAVVHAHPPYATAFAIKGEALVGKLLPETILTMPEVPLAPYALPSTDAVPESIAPFITTHSSCLLEHHGALTWAGDLEAAYLMMERLEYFARVTFLARQLDGERDLSPERVSEVRRQFGVADLR